MTPMKPLAISLGDLGGIGPEVTLKAVSQVADTLRRPIVIYGDTTALALTAESLGQPLCWVSGMPPVNVHTGVYVYSLTHLHSRDVRPARPSRAAARSTLIHLEAAVADTLAGKNAALVTAPIQKGRLAAIGFDYPGHTEFLAARTKAKHYAMMLAGDCLRVTLATIHCALTEVTKRLSTAAIFAKIALTQAALVQWFGIRHPRIAVLGLNPHASEGGLFGNEEARIIMPAIRKARRRGWHVEGPYAADGFFGRWPEVSGATDAVVCMYHDQGLIPLKMLHFWDAVNITLGLPIIRTSPDHGTAYDIAGTNRADPRSMAQAIWWAHRFARRMGK